MVNFLLSNKAIEMGWDTFVFVGRLPSSLYFGYSQDRAGPITVDTLSRWLKSLRIGTGDRIVLHKVELCRISPFSYMGTKTSHRLDGAQELDKDTYGWYDTDGEMPKGLIASGTTSFVATARLLKSKQQWEGKPVSVSVVPRQAINASTNQFDVPISLGDQAWERDRGRCLVTGQGERRQDVEAVWIFPPLFSFLSRGTYEYEESYTTIENVVLLPKELVHHFYDNAFCVDIEDDHKVYVFRDMGPARALLPSHLSEGRSGANMFWKEHFNHTLKACLMGGDICKECPDNEVIHLMVDLNICSEIGGEPYGEQVPFSDERWDSRIGRILKEYLEETDKVTDSDLSSGSPEETDKVPSTDSDLSPSSSGSQVGESLSSTTPSDSSLVNSQYWWHPQNLFPRVWSFFM